jgi:hypothetical protein
MQLTLLMRTFVTCAPLEPGLFARVGLGLFAPVGAVPPELALLDAAAPPIRQSSAPAITAKMRVRCI